MKEFLKSWRFKVLVLVLCLVLGFLLYAASQPDFGSFTSRVLSLITTPIQKVSASISQAAGGFFDRILNSNRIYNENIALREELAKLKEQMVDYDQLKAENDQYKKFLDIKTENPDMTFAPASVIGRDPNDLFSSFTIDKGSMDGIEVNDPVITSEGLVGRVYSVNSISAKVITLLDPSINVGSFVSRTKDTGITTGEVELSLKGECKLMYLVRDHGAQVGDLVITSGTGGIFPANLVIGTIEEILEESHGMSYYAVVKPTVDIDAVKSVFVVTSFKWQSTENTEE